MRAGIKVHFFHMQFKYLFHILHEKLEVYLYTKYIT